MASKRTQARRLLFVLLGAAAMVWELVTAYGVTRPGLGDTGVQPVSSSQYGFAAVFGGLFLATFAVTAKVVRQLVAKAPVGSGTHTSE